MEKMKGDRKMMREKLQNERKKRHWTKQVFATKLGVSMQYVYLLETGKKDGTLKTWAKIQNLFEIPSEEMWEYMKVQ